MNLKSTDQVKKLLIDTISNLECNRSSFVTDKAFSRTKKISFSDTMLFPMLCMNNNLSTELIDYFDLKQLPTQSAMCQRRKQIKSEAFRKMFSMFTKSLHLDKRYNGLRLIACDGTRLNLPYNPKDEDTFMNNIKGRRGINQMHMTAFHDILNDIFLDAHFDYGSDMDEYTAFNTMVDRFKDTEYRNLFIADRGFSSVNTIAHAIHSNQYFLIRQRSDSILPKIFDKEILAKDSFDINTEINVCRRTRKHSERPKNLITIIPRRKYDFINPDSLDIDTLKVRVTKIKLDNGSYEYLISNLPKGKFTKSNICELYHMRWGIETSFRTLKYASELIYIHSLDKDLVLQEIFGKLTLYNFSSAIRTVYDSLSSNESKSTKYKYVVNISQTVKICIRFIKGLIKDVLKYVGSFLLPVKPGRTFERNVRRQAAESFSYR